MFLRLFPTHKLLYLPFDGDRIQAFTRRRREAQTSALQTMKQMSPPSQSLAGSGYIVLNGLRVMNVIGFLAVITASVVMLVKINPNTHMFFFDALSHVITLITSMFLLTSELPLFRSYFARNWPLLSPRHGFVTLALAMVVLGINMMGNLNKPDASQENLGMVFWRVVISSGIIIFVLGWVNLLASYAFRDSKQDISARQVRAYGAVANLKTPGASEAGDTPPAPVLAQSYISNPVVAPSYISDSIPPSPLKSPTPFRFLSSERRQSSLPSYHGSAPRSASPEKEPSLSERPYSIASKYSRLTTCTKKKVLGHSLFNRNSRISHGPPFPLHLSQPRREGEISAPMSIHPQYTHLVQRPDSAHHPSRKRESEAYRWRV